MTYADLLRTGTANVFTIQRRRVADRLDGNSTYRARCEESAGYDEELGEGLRAAHRRAYEWLTTEYVAHMGRSLATAPIWVSFEESKRRDHAGRHHDDE